MASKFVLLCACALFVQAAVGHVLRLEPHIGYGVGGASAASSAASAAAARNAAAASAAASASAAAARKGAAGSAASSAAAASAAAARNAAAASAAAASAAAARGGSAAWRAAASSAASAGASSAGLSGYDIVYSEPLLVTSSSPLWPSGLSVSSEIALDGTLEVAGLLPFLSAVAFEGSLPTDGSGVATCGCGSDNIGIFTEV